MAKANPFLIHKGNKVQETLCSLSGRHLGWTQQSIQQENLSVGISALFIVKKKRGSSSGRTKTHEKTQIIVLNYLYMIVKD